MKTRKSYFVLPNEALAFYKSRKILASDLRVFAYLSSLRCKSNTVKVTQQRIAENCGLTTKTVASCVDRLYVAGLIEDVITEEVRQKKKYKTSVYILKPLSNSGFFLCPRTLFTHEMPHKAFAVMLLMYRANSPILGKSWNSYNDICERLGFGENQRSEIVAIIKSLVNMGLLKKTVRKVKKVFVDNIYRVADLMKSMVEKKTKENSPSDTGTISKNQQTCDSTLISTIEVIIAYSKRKSKSFSQKSLQERRKYVQGRLDRSFIFVE